jgi:hypothetical protein
MALTPFILQGCAACAAMIEHVLTTLLRDQVRRYGAVRLTSFPPRNSWPIETTRQTPTDQRDLNRRLAADGSRGNNSRKDEDHGHFDRHRRRTAGT